MAKAIARAITRGGSAKVSREVMSWARTSGFETVSTNPVCTKPGEMMVTLRLGPASLRNPSEMATTACLVAE